MKIIKLNKSLGSALSTIKKSMSTKKEIIACNNLDACGCTGNGNC